VVHWTPKYDQGVHEDYPIHCYDERYIATPINSNKFTDFDLKKVKILTWKIKKPKKPKFPLFRFLRF